MSTAIAAGVAYVANGRVLLCMRAPGKVNGEVWAFPGGHVEPNESYEDAARREFFEETGHLITEPLEFLNDDGQFVTFRYDGELFTPTLCSEHTAAQWVNPRTPNEVGAMHPGLAELLEVIGGTVSNRRADWNGWYEVKDNPISKVGVFPYSGRAIGNTEEPDRVFNVYRPEEELNNPATIESFKLVPFIDEHPPEVLGSAALDLPTVDEEKPAGGVIGEQVYYRDGYLLGNLKIFTDRLAQLVELGKREVSAGYRCVYEKAPGVFNGQPYDYIQRNIRGNHLALVNQGRMGPEVAVLDHFTFTFDAQELTKMADPEKKEGATDGELTITQLGEMVGQIAPALKQITEMLGALNKPAEVVETVEDEGGEKPAEVTPAAMDAMEKRLKALESENAALKAKQGQGLDAKDVLAEAAARDVLYKGVSAVIGTFDHAAMDTAGVAKYAADKLGITAPAGQERVAVEAFLAGVKKSGTTVKPASGLDAGDAVSPIRKQLAGA